MKRVLATVGLGALALTAAPAAHAQQAQEVPPFIQETYPEQAIKAAVEERQEVMRPGAFGFENEVFDRARGGRANPLPVLRLFRHQGGKTCGRD